MDPVFTRAKRAGRKYEDTTSLQERWQLCQNLGKQLYHSKLEKLDLWNFIQVISAQITKLNKDIDLPDVNVD